jgi:hypothetical protein
MNNKKEFLAKEKQIKGKNARAKRNRVPRIQIPMNTPPRVSPIAANLRFTARSTYSTASAEVSHLLR